MVNFRYHVVSLVAVFLALAVGVVLGAGPLQNAITRQGDAEIAGATKAQLEQALVAANALGEQGEVLADAIGQQVLPGTLEGTSLALIALPGVTEADAEALAGALQSAGASVEATVRLTDAMVSQDQNTYRETLASPVSAHLTNRPADGSAASVLAAGLVEILTSSGGESPLIREIMADEANPLVEADSLPEEPVAGLVLVGPGTTTEAPSADAGSAASTDLVDKAGQSGQEPSNGDIPPMTRDAWLALAAAVKSGSTPSAAVGQAASADQFISVLRANSSPVMTVDQGGTQMAALNVALVLAGGAEGSFGQQEGASEALAPLP